MSQFPYCPLTWMFRSRAMERRINRIHEGTLRLIYPNQHPLTLRRFQKKKPLAYNREIYKPSQLKLIWLKSRSLEIINLLFQFTNKSYNLRNASIFNQREKKNINFEK